MKINKLKINAYGKLKNKEVDLGEHINLIYGKNEAGKSTLLNFITNCFYGISKNKNGKEISDFQKYAPWTGDDFSGKLEYQLDNEEKFEVFRDFKKKNPKIFNEKMEDITKEFNIDKNRGSEFFYEQTKIDEGLFLSTILVNQQEVKLGKQEQNVFIQKIANLVGTGEDNVSFKRAMERIDRRKLDEIGTQRSREKPINIINKKISSLEAEKEELEKYENIQYEIEENKNSLQREIAELENEEKFLKEIKLMNENQKIEREKINLKTHLKSENYEKIDSIKKKVKEIQLKHQDSFEESKKIDIKKDKLNKKIIMIFLIILCLNLLSLIFIKVIYFYGIFLLTVPTFLAVSLWYKNALKKKKVKIEKNLEKVNLEVDCLIHEKDLLEKNQQELEDEVNQLENELNLKINKETQKIKSGYFGQEKNDRLELANLEDINLAIQKVENQLNNKKVELHTLDLDNKNIEPKLENLSKIEEELATNKEKKASLKKLEESINLAKEVLNESYEKMKNTVTPKFTEKLSKIIGEITDEKYNNVKLSDDAGLIVELENGNYISADRLSIGTIDQLYLSLRLSMVEELSEERMPIILDEVFAYYDTERLKNILKYMAEKFHNHQVLIFTCTSREREVLEELNIKYNAVEI